MTPPITPDKILIAKYIPSVFDMKNPVKDKHVNIYIIKQKITPNIAPYINPFSFIFFESTVDPIKTESITTPNTKVSKCLSFMLVYANIHADTLKNMMATTNATNKLIP